MDRFVPLSATTSTLGAHLAPDEEILTLQEHVGLYHGASKARRQPDGTLYLSSHRIIYVDRFAPLYHSCALSLALVRQTEYYAGFLKSSPKITLRLEPAPASVLAQQNQPPQRKKPLPELAAAEGGSQSARSAAAAPKTWICPVCGFSNSNTDKCALCGIAFEKSSAGRSTAVSAAGSAPNHSAPPTVPGTPALAAAAPKRNEPQSCPTCTFLNHPSMSACELCNTPLPGARASKPSQRLASTSALSDGQASLPAGASARARTTSLSASSSPKPQYDSDEDGDEDGTRDADDQPFPPPDPAIEYVKLSFRKGGDKAFYELLRTTLRQKAWQASHVPPSARRTDPPGDGSTASAGPLVSSSTISSAIPASSIPSFATTVDIDGRRVPLSLLRREGFHSPASLHPAQGGSGLSTSAPTRSSAGIEAILRTTSLSHTQASTSMLSALADLEALQKRAKGMVEMAEKLNAQLSRLEAEDRANGPFAGTGAGPGPGSERVDRDSATLIRSSLVMLGLPSPAVTEDMVAERGLYELELARELAGLLLSTATVQAPTSRSRQRKQIGLMGHGRVFAKGKERSMDEVRLMDRAEEDLRQHSHSNAAALIELVEDKMARSRSAGSSGEQVEEEELERVLAESTGEQEGRELIGLDEVWCVWNRARGVALVPPADLRACAVHLPRLTEPPVRLRVFPSSSSATAASTKKGAPTGSSGLCMLHTPRYSESAFEARVLARLRLARRRTSGRSFGLGVSAFELASREGAPVVLIEQMLTGIEMGSNALLVRDEGAFRQRSAGASAGGAGGPNTRWFENEFDRAWESARDYRRNAVTVR